ncbi:MAG: amino acid permease [Candidatus Dormiibacterota bacterium]
MDKPGGAPPAELRKALHLRHLIMLSVGGTIASGFLLFAGSALEIAGPSVLISYIVGGIVAFAVMACLAELCVAKPVAASFATYARDAMGKLAGFLTGWNYWLAWVMGAATESVAAGTYLHSFYAAVPVWLVAFIIIALEMTINVIGVLFMGEYEFVLSSIKVLALAAFIVIGLMAILGIGFPSHGLSNYGVHGGFFANGEGAVLAALLTVFFAYAGIEMVSVAAEESVNPARDVPRALFGTCAIVVGLFVLALAVLLAVTPWTAAGTSSSPFVDALRALHLQALAAILNWIVIVASVSSVDGAIYTASRMLFSMSRAGLFPRALARVNQRRKTPVVATAITAGCAFVGALLAYFFPTTAYAFVAGLSTFGFLFAWLMISLSQPLHRLRFGAAWVAKLRWKTPLYPLTPIVAIVFIMIALVGQFFTGGAGTPLGPVTIPGGGIAIVVGVAWSVLWAIYYYAYGRRLTHGEAWADRERELHAAYELERSGEAGTVVSDPAE